MFDRSAHLYDAFYDAMGKDFASEAMRLDEILRREARSAGRSLLDVACGTGRHMSHLAESWSVEGLDIEEGMLETARARLPGAAFHRLDMESFDLGRSFDAVVCLFSSIGYMTSMEKMRAAVASMARHLEPGGVLAIEPWFAPQDWNTGHPHMLVVDRDDLKAVRMCRSDRRDDLAVLEMHYLVLPSDGPPAHFTEHHELLLAPPDACREAIEAAGLEATYDAEGLAGRGLHLGRRPLS